LARDVAIAKGILNNPEYFIQHGPDYKPTSDDFTDADQIIKHLSTNGENLSIEDFVNAMIAEPANSR
jgi:hypothetical protein